MSCNRYSKDMATTNRPAPRKFKSSSRHAGTPRIKPNGDMITSAPVGRQITFQQYKGTLNLPHGDYSDGVLFKGL